MEKFINDVKLGFEYGSIYIIKGLFDVGNGLYHIGLGLLCIISCILAGIIGRVTECNNELNISL